MAKERWRVGIAGAHRGLGLVAGLRAVPGAEVTALCDPDTARLAEAAQWHQVSDTFSQFEAMLEKVDVVVLATPMHLHAPQAILALQAGKHVLSEVTAAVSLEECWRLRDAALASGKTYMMAENVCYQREIQIVQEMARRGLFGELYYGEGEYLHEVRSLHHHPDGRPTWRYYWQVGQNGCTYGTHGLGPVMQWFTAVEPKERIVSVTCLGAGRHTDPEHPHDDTSVMLCQLQSGKLIRVRVDMLSNRPYALNFSLQGTQGVYESARQEGQPGVAWVGENRAGVQREWHPITDWEDLLPDAWRNLSEAARNAGHAGSDFHTGRLFMEAVVRAEPPPLDLYTSLEWTAAGLCSQLSIDNGGVPIRVPDFRDASQRPLTLDAP